MPIKHVWGKFRSFLTRVTFYYNTFLYIRTNFIRIMRMKLVKDKKKLRVGAGENKKNME